MKAAIYPGGGGAVKIEELADPQPGPGEVLIRVSRCGICGTDLSMTRGGMWDFGQNTQFGHEYAGEIVELGQGVEGFAVGERIAVLPSVACGQCHSCRTLENNVLCQAMPGTAMVGFAELAKVPTSVATKLPAVLSLRTQLMQTLGLKNEKWTAGLQRFAVVYCWAYFLLNAAIPVAVLGGLVKLHA